MKKIISVLLMAAMLLSIVSVSASAAGVLYKADFSVMNESDIAQGFCEGMKAYLYDGLLVGYSDAKALQSLYYTDEETDIFFNQANTWLTYDATITLAFADDDAVEYSRFINISYCNDNLKAKGLEDHRSFVNFVYDIDNQAFKLSAGANATLVDGEEVMDPVARELESEGNEFHTFGMSVEKNRIRFFYNDELIYDYDGTAFCVADSINSPFFFWNNGNFIQIKEIVVADQGYLFPNFTDTPVDPNPADTSAPAASDPAAGTTAPADVTAGGNNAPADTSVTTTATSVVEVTNDKGEAVTNEAGEKVTSAVVVTEAPAVTTTAVVQVTDEKGEAVTNAAGEQVTSVVTNAPSTAATNNNRPQGGNSTQTGDATFAVIAAMIVALGSAVVVSRSRYEH